MLSRLLHKTGPNVTVSSITERRYNYWKKVDDVINQNGTIFDVPPAKISGKTVFLSTTAPWKDRRMFSNLIFNPLNPGNPTGEVNASVEVPAPSSL